MKTHILCSTTFFFEKSRNVYGDVEKYSTARQATDINIIWRMRIARWIIKSTNTPSEYLILIAFPQQQ